MDFQVIGRLVSFAAAAVTLFAVLYGVESPLYVALPAGLIVYTAGRIAFALFAATPPGPR
jgi:hypothetical protein